MTHHNADELAGPLQALLAYRHGDKKHLTQEDARLLYESFSRSPQQPQGGVVSESTLVILRRAPDWIELHRIGMDVPCREVPFVGHNADDLMGAIRDVLKALAALPSPVAQEETT